VLVWAWYDLLTDRIMPRASRVLWHTLNEYKKLSWRWQMRATPSEVSQGHWKWYHYIDWVWFPISVLYNFVHRSHHSGDMRHIIYRDLETRVRVTQGHQIWYHSIQHNVPSRTVSEINGDFGRKCKFSPPSVYLTPPPLKCGSVAEWLGCWTCDQ